MDCNSFFVSCECIFNPKLKGQPVVVLSSNDGCIVARSKEAKDLGIPMGAPFFQWADFFKVHGVISYSSNFALYADISHRVMQTIRYFADPEIYSIDECFLDLSELSPQEVVDLCVKIKKTILQWVGIPVSIGIGASKTLAKAANYLAKTKFYDQGIFFLSKEHENEILSRFPVGKIWGIGGRLERYLHKHGIKTAFCLKNLPDEWVKKNLTVIGLRTVFELRGISCLECDDAPSAKKSILCSRSFGQLIVLEQDLAEAVATHTARAAEKLRSQSSFASYMEVFIHTSKHRQEPFFIRSARIFFPEATAYTPLLINYAKQVLTDIFEPNRLYKKAGVMLGGIIPNKSFQQNLFLPQDKNARLVFEKQQRLMNIIDQANEKFGYDIVQFAAQGVSRNWRTRQNHCSQCFTTRWEEQLTIKI